ncbi:hypothetical protein KR215_007263 [Drosophila sulfurigaster]|uniref:Uncharacterized protein LOC117567822 n=1 Tax=Drosophila albomicans TaxID=7291 RepID=A0A6P8WMT5_DROAB|nr:uncharacterized protein LOC117567822 [Drosophila albomicans]XP_062140211.1 uncharacterized protein LOC133848594 [Drosophila sulfurigaster albostrigata]KAH8403528.1 hypothetical protein KR215_007263 [Drosophila sulfurigaster]
MSDHAAVSGVLNALLCGVTGYGFYALGPQQHPYAFTACVIGFCHGLLGIVECCSGDSNVTSAKETTNSIMEIVPLPLVNIELFFGGEGNNIALGHGLFIVPMAISAIVALVKGSEEGDETMETLKLLTILGNITSLCYLAVNEGSWVMGGMAALAFMSKYGAEFLEQQLEGSGEPIKYLSWSGFYFLTTLAVGGEK